MFKAQAKIILKCKTFAKIKLKSKSAILNLAICSTLFHGKKGKNNFWAQNTKFKNGRTICSTSEINKQAKNQNTKTNKQAKNQNKQTS